MMKHIIGQSIYQLIVMIVFVFFGEHFIPEYADSYDSSIFLNHPSWKWSNGVIGGTVRSGRMITIMGDDDYQTIYDDIEI
jgi:Ca2+ transporting ATPase